MRTTIPSKRIWLMRGLSILIAIFPFFIAETVIRLSGMPIEESVDSDPWVDLQQLEPLFVKNEAGDRWIIPNSRSNFFCEASFSATKTPHTRRIFVLGGSTVQGRPFATETSFSTWLRLKLEASDPKTTFEVVNCGGVSYASYRIAKVLDQVMQHEPDAIVLYTGHNEFLEDREYSEVRQLSPTRQGIARVARHSRLVTWIQKKIKPTPKSSSILNREVSTRLDHENGMEQYRRDPAWRNGIETHFASTLREMVNQVCLAKIPLILCVPASDLIATAPFKTTPDPNLSPTQLTEFNAQWKIACDLQQTQETRFKAAKACLNVDRNHAGANYLCGRIAFEQGSQDEAIKKLTLARDQDVCPLRATSNIESTVRAFSNHAGIFMIDVPKLLDQQNYRSTNLADGLPDTLWFLDHVHPSIKGHQVIAEACFDVMQPLSWVEETEGTKLRFEQSVTQHLANLDESYFGRGKQRLEGLIKWTQGKAKTKPASTAQSKDTR